MPSDRQSCRVPAEPGGDSQKAEPAGWRGMKGQAQGIPHFSISVMIPASLPESPV